RALEVRGRRRRRKADTEAFRRALLDWYGENEREFPWRKDGDPWRVLMCEVCLRHKRADQVVPVYERLCNIAPNPREVLNHKEDVVDAMRSLGLHRRAQNLLNLAQVLVEKHGGEVPGSVEELMSLPGVGHYVAAAVV